MIPLGDDNSGRLRSPLATYVFIALNVIVFVFFQRLGTNERFTYAFATVPREITTGRDVATSVTITDPVSGLFTEPEIVIGCGASMVIALLPPIASSNVIAPVDARQTAPEPETVTGLLNVTVPVPLCVMSLTVSVEPLRA